jgi:hypothetical protein
MCLVCLGATVSSANVKVSLGTSSAGSTPYVMGGAFSKIVNSQQDVVQVSPQATAGYNENIILVSSGDLGLGQSFASTFIDAYYGTGPFKGKAQKDLRMMFIFLVAPYHIITRESADIKTVADLKGKKINIGIPAQSTRAYNEAFLEAVGIGPNDFKMYEMSTGQTFRALQDGVIDVSLNFLTPGSGQLVELTTNTKIRLLSLPKDLADKLQKSNLGMKLANLPANLYDGTDYPVNTVAIVAVVFCNKNMSNEVAYEITKGFWGNMTELNKIKVFKSLKLEDADPNGFDVPYHPGVLKFFKEAGLIK